MQTKLASNGADILATNPKIDKALLDRYQKLLASASLYIAQTHGACFNITPPLGTMGHQKEADIRGRCKTVPPMATADDNLIESR